MTHLRIEQNNIPEQVNATIIHKLHEVALSVPEPNVGEEDSAYLAGNLQTTYAYKSDVDYLTDRFANLYITGITDYYIKFEDSAVYNILSNAGIGDGTGITTNAAGNVTGSQIKDLFKNNTAITSFDEFKYFTTVNNSGIPYGVFENCSNLTSIDLSNVKSINASAFRNCSNLNIEINMPNYGNVILEWQIFRQTKISKILDLGMCTQINDQCFQYCTNLTEVTLPTTCITLQSKVFEGCTNLSLINVENIMYMGECVFSEVMSVTEPFYFKELLYQNRESERNGLFTGGSPYVYAPKLQSITGGQDSGGNNCRGAFINTGWNVTRSNKKIVYFKNLSSVETGAFCGGIVKHLIINNATPPTVTQYVYGNQNLLIDVRGGGVSSSVVQNVWVPDSAVTTYQQDTYWGEFGNRIQGLSGMNKVATKELWDQLSSSSKEDTLIEEYM